MNQRPRTSVLFSTAAFNTSERRPYFLNDGCYGDDLLRVVAALLRARGASVAEAPGQEDFGWYLDFVVAGVGYCLVVGYRPDDAPDAAGPGSGTWIATLERARGLVGSLLGLRGAGVGLPALRLVHEVLSLLPGVSSLRWLREEDLRSGREGQVASPTPDAP